MFIVADTASARPPVCKDEHPFDGRLGALLRLLLYSLAPLSPQAGCLCRQGSGLIEARLAKEPATSSSVSLYACPCVSYGSSNSDNHLLKCHACSRAVLRRMLDADQRRSGPTSNLKDGIVKQYRLVYLYII